METSRDIERIAAAWIAKRDSGDWRAIDQAAVDEWLRVTANRVAFIRLETAWRQTQRLRALAAGLQLGIVSPAGERGAPPAFDGGHCSAGARESKGPRRGQQSGSDEPADSETNLEAQCPASGNSQAAIAARDRRFWSIRGLTLAAAVVIGATLCFTWAWRPRGGVYHTDVGGLVGVPLPDGSRITLNTNSGIRVAVTETERSVELDQGEAFFEVAKDSLRPFVVKVGDRRIIAVGTKFAVKRDPQEVQVMVTDGHVRVEQANSGAGEPVAQLSPGNVAHANDAGVLVEARPLPEVEEYLSWRSGFLIFHETPLADAVAQFNRYNTRKIIVSDPSIAATRIGGSFRAKNVDAFVRLLRSALPIRVEQDDRQIVLRTMASCEPACTRTSR
jgi:transmembrane sensor